MDAQPTLITSLPKSSTAYVFGSFLRSNSPRDLDVLIVYDQRLCAPSEAYRYHDDFIRQIQSVVNIDVDVTLLTQEEVKSSRFIENTDAIPFGDVMRRPSERSRRKDG